jgi:hypothetical protein
LGVADGGHASAVKRGDEHNPSVFFDPTTNPPDPAAPDRNVANSGGDYL